MIELRQSTAVSVFVGQFVDKDDALTEETGLAGTMTAKVVKKGGSSLGARNSGSAITHLGNGHYAVPLDATDTNTLGWLRLAVSDASTHLGVWEDFAVVAQQYWDSKYGPDKLQVDVREAGGSAVSGLSDFKADVSGLSTFDATSDNVTVGGITAGALALFVTEDTGEVSAGSGSVVELAQGSATEATVQSAMTAQGYTVARAGKLDYLDAAVSSVSGGAGGPGGYLRTVAVTISGVAEDNVAVWLTTDAAGSNWYAGTKYTNSDGEVTFMVDLAATYYVWGEKGGKNISNNGAAWTVS